MYLSMDKDSMMATEVGELLRAQFERLNCICGFQLAKEWQNYLTKRFAREALSDSDLLNSLTEGN